MGAEGTEDKIMKLVRRLLLRTKSDDIEWESRDTWTFMVEFPEYDIRLESDNRPPEDYTLSVVNNDGKVIEKLSLGQGYDDYDLLHELYNLARRKALGVDEALDSLLEEIG